MVQERKHHDNTAGKIICVKFLSSFPPLARRSFSEGGAGIQKFFFRNFEFTIPSDPKPK
jgi:hypothetical protein